jgi:hypothetical protein
VSVERSPPTGCVQGRFTDPVVDKRMDDADIRSPHSTGVSVGLLVWGSALVPHMPASFFVGVGVESSVALPWWDRSPWGDCSEHVACSAFAWDAPPRSPRSKVPPDQHHSSATCRIRGEDTSRTWRCPLASVFEGLPNRAQLGNRCA